MKIRRFCLIAFLFTAPWLFAVVPIQERSLRGAAAAEARLKLLAAAETCLGTPYRYGGVDRRGLDCSGFVFLSFREGPQYTVPRTSEGIYNWTQRIATSELRPGDLVFFVTAGTRVSHVGIYTGDGRFIHSASDGPRTGVIYSHLDESYWKRTYKGAGRALPWDEEAAQAMIAARNGAAPRPGGSPAAANPAGFPSGTPSANPSRNPAENPARNPDEGLIPSILGPVWTEPGYFAGFGAAWSWGQAENSGAPFGGVSAQATVGYKWSRYRTGLELRPEWNNTLGVFRLPLTLSIGTDVFQIFFGPAFTFGDPSIGDRRYDGGGAWLWQVGFSGAFPIVSLGPGAISIYGELVWQRYHLSSGQDSSSSQDIAANVRFSTGIRYFWKLGSSK